MLNLAIGMAIVELVLKEGQFMFQNICAAWNNYKVNRNSEWHKMKSGQNRGYIFNAIDTIDNLRFRCRRMKRLINRFPRALFHLLPDHFY